MPQNSSSGKKLGFKHSAINNNVVINEFGDLGWQFVFFLSKLFHPALSYCDSTLD
jgi:hypothetical protein